MREYIAALILCFTLSVFFSESSAWGQVIHIKPPFNDVPKTNKVLATVVASSDSAVYLSMTNSKIAIKVEAGSSRIFDLAGKTVQELAFFIGSEFDENEVRLDVKRPSALLTQIEPELFKETQTVQGGDSIELKSRGGEPVVDIGFAGLLALESPDADDDDNLLESAGFQLDLTGEERIYETGGRVNASAYVTMRVGLGANETLQVAEQDSGDRTSAGQQVENALQQADLISLSLQFDQFFSPNSQTNVNIYSLGAITYINPDPFVLPLTISSGGADVPLAEVFDTEQLNRLQRDLDVVRPLLEFGGGTILRFNRRDEPLFYFGAGIHGRQLLRRGFRFRREQNGDVDPESLGTIFKEEWASFWKVVGGIRLSENFDMRFDAATPFDRGRTDALLRIAIARTFPVLN